MKTLCTLRLEINYFLALIFSLIGEEEKDFAQEALDMLITYYFWGENVEFCQDYIERIEDYISQILDSNDINGCLLNRNIENILDLLKNIQNEIS